MDLSVTLDYLKDLAANNNRPWFNDNKERYTRALAEFEELVTALIARISEFDSSVKHLDAKSCTYRIYRDLRFSADKTPYKIHMGAYVCARGKQSKHCGYYFHIQPEGTLFAGGTYGLTPAMMRAVRQSILDDIDEYRSIVDAPDFKKSFPQIGERMMRTAPKGFDKNSPYIEYIKPKDFTLWHAIPDSTVTSPEFTDRLVELCRQAKPFLDFLNFTIDDYI